MINMIGKKSGRLTVIRFAKINSHRTAMWECKCICGKVSIVRGTDLRKTRIKSCGCYSSEVSSAICKKRNSIHGKASRTDRARVYRIWAAMKTRCYNKNQKQYKDYGGRGIYVCEEWERFENFFNDMGHPPTDKHQIDRIDNDGSYEKDNCRWVLPIVNIRNGRSVKLSMDKAKEIKMRYGKGNITYMALAIEYGVSKGAINHVLNNRHWAE